MLRLVAERPTDFSQFRHKIGNLVAQLHPDNPVWVRVLNHAIPAEQLSKRGFANSAHAHDRSDGHGRSHLLLVEQDAFAQRLKLSWT